VPILISKSGVLCWVDTGGGSVIPRLKTAGFIVLADNTSLFPRFFPAPFQDGKRPFVLRAPPPKKRVLHDPASPGAQGVPPHGDGPSLRFFFSWVCDFTFCGNLSFSPRAYWRVTLGCPCATFAVFTYGLAPRWGTRHEVGARAHPTSLSFFTPEARQDWQDFLVICL